MTLAESLAFSIASLHNHRILVGDCAVNCLLLLSKLSFTLALAFTEMVVVKRSLICWLKPSFGDAEGCS